jgi:hypothetical protein
MTELKTELIAAHERGAPSPHLIELWQREIDRRWTKISKSFRKYKCFEEEWKKEAMWELIRNGLRFKPELLNSAESWCCIIIYSVFIRQLVKQKKHDSTC